jgi:hypothetical protein
MSGLGLLHQSHPGIMDPRPKILFQGISKPTLAKKTWVPKKLYIEKQKTAENEIFYKGTSSVSFFMQDLVRYLELQLKKGRQDKEEDTHSLRGSEPT